MTAQITSSDITGGQEARYDAQAKRLLVHRSFLAPIFAHTIDEFKGMSPDDIVPYIEAQPHISSEPVEPTSVPSKIDGTAEESNAFGEGLIRYDLKTYVTAPRGNERIKIIVNVEVQNDYHPGYEIVTRGVYYVARMISEQKGREFEASGYNGIKKVYSIWLCLNAPGDTSNTVSAYEFHKRDIVDHSPDNPDAYDKMVVVLVGLNEHEASHSKFLDMLNLAFSSEEEQEGKIQKLETEYNLHMSNELKEDIRKMSGLGRYLRERAYQQGVKDTQQKTQSETESRIISNLLRTCSSCAEVARMSGVSLARVQQIAKEQNIKTATA